MRSLTKCGKQNGSTSSLSTRPIKPADDFCNVNVSKWLFAWDRAVAYRYLVINQSNYEASVNQCCVSAQVGDNGGCGKRLMLLQRCHRLRLAMRRAAAVPAQ